MELAEAQYKRFAPLLPVRHGNVTLSNPQTLNVLLYVTEQPLLERFGPVRYHPFLPLNQIAEDVCRHELDRRLLIDVPGCPPDICDEGGPIYLIRKKLAAEPQIHGGKKSRIEFVDPDDEKPINPASQPPPMRASIRYVERQVSR